MSSQLPDYILFTDGGARGNPGPAGAGAVIKKGDTIVKKIAKPLGKRTNNWAEYEAVIVALEELKKLVPESKRKETVVEVRLDSELIARQLSGKYQVKEETLFSQYIKAHNLLVKDFPQTTFVHIPREKNKEADALSNEAMDLSAH